MSEVNNETVGQISDADLAALDQALSDIPEQIEDFDLPVEGDVETEVENVIAREEAYEAQEPESVDIHDAPEAPAPKAKKAKGKKASGAKAPKAPKGPVVERDLSKIDEAFFQLADETPDRSAVLARRPGQKKIAEKFDNLFQALAAGKKPSVYTMDSFGVLDVKGEVTSSDLVNALKAEDYSDGTARSQAGQMMALFPAVGVAIRSGQKLTLVEGSKIAERLRAVA